MTRNLHRQKSSWMVIDETGSEGDDNFPSTEEDSDYEVEILPNKVVANVKDKSKALVVVLDEPYSKAPNIVQNESINGRTSVTKDRKKGFNGISDVSREEKSSKNNVAGNEIIIDDEEDDDIKLEMSIPVKNRKQKKTSEMFDEKSDKTTEASSSRKKSRVDRTGEYRSTAKLSEHHKIDNDEKKDSDDIVEYPSSSFSKKSKRKDKDKLPVVDIDTRNHQASTKDKDVTADTEVRKKRSKRKADEIKKHGSGKTDVKLLSRNEIIIDDDDDDGDIKLETSILSKSVKRKEALPDRLGVKRMKETEASSSKQKLGVNETGKQRCRVELENRKVNDDEEKEDSDDIVEYKSREKTKKKDKDKDKISVIGIDKRKPSTRDKDGGVSSSTAGTEVRKKESKGKAGVRKKQESAENNTTSLSRNQIIIDDDDDDDDIKLETTVPNRSTKRREVSVETLDVKKKKTTKASSSKQKLAIGKTSESSHGVDLEIEKLSEDVNGDSDSVVEYQSSSKRAAKRNKDKVSVIGSDKPDHRKKKNIEDKKPTASKNIENKGVRRKRFISEADSREEKGSSDADVTLVSSDEITIDDDDNEDTEWKIEIPVKNSNRKGSRETAATAKKARTVETSKSKKRLKIDKSNENLPLVEPEIDKPIQVEKDNFDNKVDVEWTDSSYLAEFNQIEPEIAENLITLFENDNTIPFIARYRKEITGGMEPEQLRNIKNTYDNIKLIKQRALKILKSIDTLGKWSPEIHATVTAAKTMDELEHIYTPFKPGAKGSLAERAKELGLGPIGETILQGRAVPSLSSLVDYRREGLRNENEVKQGIIHIIAEVISKDKTTFEGIHKLRETAPINIESTISKAASSSKGNKKGQQNVDHSKYETYFNFSAPEKRIRDYQILAINRGESQKILSVKIVFPDWFQHRLKDHCLQKYAFVRKVSNFHYNILEESFNDAYNRLIKGLVTRQVRHDLNERAANASIEVFAGNLKKLLLIPPLRGETILGVDPGFKHGCKLAVISQFGNVLDTATIRPHIGSQFEKEQGSQTLVNLIRKHSCKIVALGNATACRETEMFLVALIKAGAFYPLDVSYTIVNEAGASIYSCSPEAKSEFPTLDPNIISAISIARRLQDPLAELIKVEPQHLGIGMYQLDLPKKQLQLTLDEVISETVSFIGVDINTASHCLLRKVAGLSPVRATNIISRRDKCGPFTNRQELLEVKGIGKKFFEQCAGFIRILPETALTGNGRLPAEKLPLDYLDQTWIHPESYHVARQFIEYCKCDINELGTDKFIREILGHANWPGENLAYKFGTTETSMDIIIKGLSMRKGEDIRVKEDGPLFRRNCQCMEDLCVDTKVTGVVTNVTNFGTFVDIGVGTAGLIPISKTGRETLSVGQRVEVVVCSIDKERQRISLSLHINQI